MNEATLLEEILAPFVAETADEMATHESIAHYTTTACLLSMLENNEFWLSNVMSMNDIAEIRGAASAIERQYLQNRTGFPEAEKPFLDLLTSSLSNISRYACSKTYVLCFSAHNSQTDREGRLSMWRAYAGDGDGVCLVMRRRNLMRDEIVDFPVVSISMRYESEEQFLARVGSLAAHARALFDRHRAFSLSLGNERLAQLLAYAFTLMAISHKHSGFSEEQELRLFHVMDLAPLALDGLRYDAVPAGRIAKPVLRMKVHDYPTVGLNDTKFSDFLEEVVVGPSVNSDIQCVAVRLALDKYGLQHVAVRASSIPYRAPR